MIGVDAVPDEALVVEAGGMDAPTIGIEKLDAFECEAALRGHFEGGNGTANRLLVIVAFVKPGSLAEISHEGTHCI